MERSQGANGLGKILRETWDSSDLLRQCSGLMLQAVFGTVRTEARWGSNKGVAQGSKWASD